MALCSYLQSLIELKTINHSFYLLNRGAEYLGDFNLYLNWFILYLRILAFYHLKTVNL